MSIAVYDWYNYESILNYIKKKLFVDSTSLNLFNTLLDKDNLENYDFKVQQIHDETYVSENPFWIKWTGIEKFPFKLKNIYRIREPTPSELSEIEMYQSDIIYTRPIQKYWCPTIGTLDDNSELILFSNPHMASSYHMKTCLQRQNLNYPLNPLFIHRFMVELDSLKILKVDNRVLRILSRLGINESVLVYKPETILKFFKKYDGIAIFKNLFMVVKKNTNIMKLKETFVFSKEGMLFPEFKENQPENDRLAEYQKFYATTGESFRVYSNSERFRENLLQKIYTQQIKPEDLHINITNIITASITNGLRPFIYHMITEISDMMAFHGKIVCAGGDAINLQLPKQKRDISPDIDTKFILYNIDSLSESEYFIKLLDARKDLWYVVLEKILSKWNSVEFYSKIYDNILLPLQNSFPLNIFGVTFILPSDIKREAPFKKRFTPFVKNSEKNPPFLFNTQLFAIDMYINSIYYLEYSNPNSIQFIFDSSQTHYIPGVLDIPFVQPKHLGHTLHDPLYTTEININYTNTDLTNTPITSLNVIKSALNFDLPNPIKLIVANKKYALHDAEILKKLGLRTGEKAEKDIRRIGLLADFSIKRKKEIIEVKKYTELIEYTKISFSSTLPLNKIVKYICPPKIQGVQSNGIIDCPQGATVKVDTGKLYDYKESIKRQTHIWTECSKEDESKLDVPNCDIAYNIFEFRFDSKSLSEWFRPNSMQEEIMGCILQKLYDYLNTEHKNLGNLIYGWRPILTENIELSTGDHNESSENILTNLIVSNILIYSEGLLEVTGKFKPLCIKIFNLLISMTEKRRSKRLLTKK